MVCSCENNPGIRRIRLHSTGLAAIDAYHPRTFSVVNLELEAEERIGETRVLWRPVEALAAVEEVLWGGG